MAYYVEIERQYSAGLSIQYPDESAAEHALEKSFFRTRPKLKRLNSY